MDQKIALSRTPRYKGLERGERGVRLLFDGTGKDCYILRLNRLMAWIVPNLKVIMAILRHVKDKEDPGSELGILIRKLR